MSSLAHLGALRSCHAGRWKMGFYPAQQLAHSLVMRPLPVNALAARTNADDLLVHYLGRQPLHYGFPASFLQDGIAVQAARERSHGTGEVKPLDHLEQLLFRSVERTQ